MTVKVPLQRLCSSMVLGACLTLPFASTASAATGYVTLSASGKTVLKTCNPGNSSSVTTCKVTSLPGEDGYNLVASRSSPITINGVTIGTQYEKVWRNCTDPTLYIFGIRAQLNSNQWDGSGLAFNLNDLLRQTRTDKPVSIAYSPGSPAAAVALKVSGRTAQGLNEYDESQPDRNNAWVDFRIDTNAGQGGPNSPWLLTKTKAPEGYSLQDFALRYLNSEDEDVDQNSIYAQGYQPVCTTDDCAPQDDDD